MVLDLSLGFGGLLGREAGPDVDLSIMINRMQLL